MAAPRRRSLVIATGHYTDPSLTRLRSPAADARELGRVLADPAIGGFEPSEPLLDRPSYEIREAIEGFFTDAHNDDTLLFYISCHGVRKRNELYFATTDTKLGYLASTSVDASFVRAQMNQSPSTRTVVILDCCNGGLFDRGQQGKAAGDSEDIARLEGYGRFTITASSALEWALSDDDTTPSQDPRPSYFTGALVRGLDSGDADLDRDGLVGPEELFRYARAELERERRAQTPQMSANRITGDGFYLARRHHPVRDPIAPDDELVTLLRHPNPRVRLVAVQELTAILTGPHEGKALGARRELERLTKEDDQVREAARVALAARGFAPSASDQAPTIARTDSGRPAAPPAAEDRPVEATRSQPRPAEPSTPDRSVASAAPPTSEHRPAGPPQRSVQAGRPGSQESPAKPGSGHRPGSSASAAAQIRRVRSLQRPVRPPYGSGPPAQEQPVRSPGTVTRLPVRRPRTASAQLRAFAAVVLVLAAISTLVILVKDHTGGGGTGGTAAGTGDGQLVYGFDTEFPQDLSPLTVDGNTVATSYAEVRVLSAPFRAYPDFTYKADADLVVGEPTSTTSSGKQVVTYKINPKAVWSDGRPITAKDFEFTWRLQRSTDAERGCSDLLSTHGYDQIGSVESSDGDKTVTVTFTQPYGDWRSLFTLFPQHLMDKTDAKANCAVVRAGWPTAGGVPVSSGPYLLDKTGVDVGRKLLTLTRNPRWWGAPSKLKRIVLQSIGNDPAVAVSALRNREIQMIFPQPQQELIEQVAGLAPQVTSRTDLGPSFEHLDFNTKDPQLAQLPVRQAIAYALDRAEIVARTVGRFDSRAQVLNNRYLVNNQPYYADGSGGLYDVPDIAKSDQLLQALGYRKGRDGIYAKGSQRLSFEIMTTQANPLRQSTIEIIAQQLKPAGIAITPYYDPDIFAGADKPRSLVGGHFQIALFAWVSGLGPSQNASIYASPQGTNIGQNYTRGSDAKVDALLPRVAAETDPKRAADLGNEVDRQLWKDVFTIPLYQKPTYLAYDSDYTGIVANGTYAGPLWDATNITVKA